MSFWITHRGGAQERDPALAKLEHLYNELEIDDDEHPGVSVCHESEWCLSAYGSGLLGGKLGSQAMVRFSGRLKSSVDPLKV